MTRLLARASNGGGLFGQGQAGEMSKGQMDGPTIELDKCHEPLATQSLRYQNIVHVQQLIDLTDKPIRLTRDEIGWSRVKSNASNCICCCCNNSITLVTTDDSYVLDHIPLDNIQAAQANSSLQFLALANDERLAVIDLVESKLGPQGGGVASKGRLLAGSRPIDHEPTRFVDLAALDLSMGDVLFWRWIDEPTLALATKDTLYTCQVDQVQINHPAATALVGRSINQLLSLTRVCDIDPNLGQLCQVTDVQRDASTNLYAISGLYSPQTIISFEPTNTHQPQPSNDTLNTLVRSQHDRNHDNNNNHLHTPVTKLNHLAPGNPPLRHNFNSVPGRLSQMAGGLQLSSPEVSLRLTSSRAVDSLRRKISVSSRTKKSSVVKCDVSTVGGLVQIYCKLRDCSQVIRAHAVSFASRSVPQANTTTTCDDQIETRHSTTLVAAHQSGNKFKVYFIGMATTDDLTTPSQNVARSIRIDPRQLGEPGRADFPTAIVCTALTTDDERAHVAMLVTKHGHLFVFSITQGSILFDIQVSHDIVSGAVLESKSRGLMLICRNGQVLLVRVNEDKLKQMLEETNSLRHVPSQRSINIAQTPLDSSQDSAQQLAREEALETLDIGLEVIISTKL